MMNTLDRLVRVVLIGLTAAMTVLVATQIVLRYFFRSPLPWGEEVTRYLFIYLIFLGAASGVHHGTHVSIDALVRRTGAVGWWIDLVGKAIVAIFLALLVWFGVQLSMQTMGQKSPALGIPIGIAYLAIPIGALLSLIFLWGPKKPVEEEISA